MNGDDEVVVPKILGFSAAVLATAFILALPSLFKAKPANGVEPIRFGADPVLGLSTAELVDQPPKPRRAEPSLPEPIPVIIPVIAAQPPPAGALSTGEQDSQEGAKTVRAGPTGGVSGKGKPPGQTDDELVDEPAAPVEVEDEDGDGEETEDEDEDEEDDDDDDEGDEAVRGTGGEGRAVEEDGEEGEDD